MMCKYCDPTYKVKDSDETNLIEGGFKETYMEMFLTQSVDDESYWFLHVMKYNDDATTTSEFSIPVNNCPMCGRLLNTKKVETYKEIIDREG